MASCPPERALGPQCERIGAGRRMQAGPGASGPAPEGSARECDARPEGRARAASTLRPGFNEPTKTNHQNQDDKDWRKYYLPPSLS